MGLFRSPPTRAQNVAIALLWTPSPPPCFIRHIPLGGHQGPLLQDGFPYSFLVQEANRILWSSILVTSLRAVNR